MTGATLICEIGWVTPTTETVLFLDDSVRGLLDTNTLGDDDTWIDVSAYVSYAEFECGTDRVDGPIVTYDPGTGTLLLRNEDGRFDPENLDGPYVSGGISQVGPMARVRFRALYDGVGYPLWSGYADDFLVDDRLRTSDVTVPLVDAMSAFAAFTRSASAPGGASELPGARIERILDSLQWDDSARVIDTGDTTLAATTLDGDGLTELQVTADAEIGEFYIDNQGRATFRDRYALLTETRSSVSNGTFGDEDPEIRYSDAPRDKSRKSIFNRVTVTRSGGTEQVAEDTSSQTQYLTRTYSRTDLPLETDAQALDWASWALSIAGQPETRFSGMELRPDRDPTVLFPHALGRLLGDRITVKRRPPHGLSTVTRDAFIRGIKWTVRPARGDDGHDWTVNWKLQSATRYAFMTLDSATTGILDSNALGY